MSRIRVLSCLSAFLVVGCASTLPRADEVITRTQLEPLELLPQDAALYLRVSPRGWQEIRVATGALLGRWTRGLERDSTGASLVDPRLLLALQPVLDRDPAGTGLDPERPLFFAIHSVDSADLEQVVSLGGYVVPRHEVPVGVLTSVLLPSADADALVRTVEAWWTETGASKPGVRHQVKALDGWVRLDTFGGRDTQQYGLDHAFAQALDRSSGTSLRTTPALAVFLTQPADLALYAPLEQLRRVATVSSAMSMGDALVHVNPRDVALIAAAASSELYDQWLVLDPVGSELEDVGVTVNVTPGSDLQVDALATLTELGRRIAARPGGALSVPRMKEAPLALDLRASLGLMPGDVPLPAVSASLRTGKEGIDPRKELERKFDATRHWGYLGILRAPWAWMRMLSTLNPTAGRDALDATALHLRMELPPKSDFLRRWPEARLATILKFPTGAAADRFVLSTRAAQSDWTAAIERLRTEADGSASVFVGINVNASEALVLDGAPQELPAGIRAAISQEILQLFGWRRRAAEAMSSLFAAGPMQIEFSQEETVSRFRMSLGANPPVAVESRAFAFAPITHEPEDGCRATVAAHFALINGLVPNVDPLHDKDLSKAIDSIDAATACAKEDPTLAAYVEFLKDRAHLLHQEARAVREELLEERRAREGQEPASGW